MFEGNHRLQFPRDRVGQLHTLCLLGGSQVPSTYHSAVMGNLRQAQNDLWDVAK